MKLHEIVDALSLEDKTGTGIPDKEVTGGYSGDLLSDVIANAENGFVWVTIQVHLNIVAVASLKGISAVVLANNREPDEDTLNKAREQQIPVMKTPLPAFEVIGRLYALGLRCR